MRSDRSGATQGRPRSHADGLRRGPQRLKTASRGLHRPPEAPRRAWERLRSDCRAILGPPEPRKTSKSAVLSANFMVFAISQGSLQQRPTKAPKGAPREARMSPRRAPGGPRSQEPPRRLQEPPGARQEAPKTTQERPRRAPKGALWEPTLASS